LLGGLTTLSALAGPLELNKKLTENVDAEKGYVHSDVGLSYFVRKRIPTRKEYVINVDATNYKTPHTNATQRTLGFEIDDNTTTVYVSDSNANGLSNNDFFALRHKFRGKNKLFLSIEYQGDEDYTIYGTIEREDNEEQFSIKTSDLNFLTKLLVKRKIRPIVGFGKRLYKDLVEAVYLEKEPELPYEDVKRALSEVEQYLTDTNSPSKNLESGLLKLSERYLQIIRAKEPSK
jgi:hypothetical protein